MKTTTIRVNEEIKEKLFQYEYNYKLNSISQILDLILNYIERNHIDLNVDFNSGTYNVVKNFEESEQKRFENISVQMIKDAKRLEHLISVVKNIEKEYFFPLKEQGLLKVATEREMKEDLKYKDLFEDLINKISSIYSTKRQMDVFLVDITKTEFNILKDYARKF